MERSRDPRRGALAREPAPAEPALELPAPGPRQRFQLRRAVRTFRRLVEDPDATENAIEVSYAIGLGDFERSFLRFSREPAGRRLLVERPSLLARLLDRAALERLPDASLGRAYLAYLDSTGFRADGLLSLEQRVRARWEQEEGMPAVEPARAWFRDRAILVHDLEHVLTGYGTDEVGEATLLAFDLGQRPGFAGGLLAVGACFETWRALGRPWLGYVRRAWRRGRRARWLVTLPYEDLLALPLESARVLAGIEPAGRAHPGGLFRGPVAGAAA